MATLPSTKDEPVQVLQAAADKTGSGYLFSIRHVNPTAAADDAIVQDPNGNPVFTSKAKGANNGEVQYYPFIWYEYLTLSTLDSGFVEVVFRP